MKRKKQLRCPLCHTPLTSVLHTVKRISIYECTSCKIGVSSRTLKSKTVLYNSTQYYSFSVAQNRIEKYLWKFERLLLVLRAYVRSGTILDVGTGFGLFPRLLSAHKNYSVIGLEPHLKPLFVEHNQGVTIVKKPFMRYHRKARSLTAVTMFDVLEHFSDPVAVLKKAHGMLKKNGYIFLLVPNYQSVMRYLSKKWPWWMIEDHYVHFSRASLKKALRISGFQVEYIETFEHKDDVWIQIRSRFQTIRNPVLRKGLKAITLAPLYALYLVFRPLIWRLYGGGLLFIAAKKHHA